MTKCLECKNLKRVYESKRTRYLAARSAVLYRISTEFAAKQQVDMERAKNNVEEHLLTCPFRRQSEMPRVVTAARVFCSYHVPGFNSLRLGTRNWHDQSTTQNTTKANTHTAIQLS